MTEEQLIRSGSETANMMLLKHLWAMMMRLDQNPEAALQRTSRTLLDHANDAPMTNIEVDGVEAADLELIRQYTISNLEQFFDSVHGAL